jgi:hypothetical protein
MPLIATERTWLSRYVPTTLEVSIYQGGEVGDPDDQALAFTMVDVLDQPVFSDRAATRVDEGVYSIVLNSDDVATPGLYDLVGSYALDDVDQTLVVGVEVGEGGAYDALNDDMRAMVERVYWRFADLFDSPAGGPHLQVYVQTHYGRNRMAQALATAIGKINVMGQPFQSYSVEDFPVDTWGGLAEQMLYVEVVEHLRRSYTEQPNDSGVNVAMADRRDYWSRWGTILAEAKADLKPMISTFKIRHMGLGRAPRLLVSGGVFGSAPGRRPPVNAARPRFQWRFYLMTPPARRRHWWEFW